jgi:hypothetical protein
MSLCPRGTILSPGDNFVPRDKVTFGDILAIMLTFFIDNAQRQKDYSRDIMPGDPGHVETESLAVLRSGDVE